MRVGPGSRWRHVASGDERTVIDVVPYCEAAQITQKAAADEGHGETLVARLARVRASDGWIARDCRDSSDMLLTPDGSPRSPTEWVRLDGLPPSTSPAGFPVRTCQSCGWRTTSTSTIDQCIRCGDSDGLRPRHFLTRDKADGAKP